jgi:hypothetical protein
MRSKWVDGNARYYRLSNNAGSLIDTVGAPQEELTGSVRLKFTKNWSTVYDVTQDLDSNTTRRQSLGLRYQMTVCCLRFFIGRLGSTMMRSEMSPDLASVYLSLRWVNLAINPQNFFQQRTRRVES